MCRSDCFGFGIWLFSVLRVAALTYRNMLKLGLRRNWSLLQSGIGLRSPLLLEKFSRKRTSLLAIFQFQADFEESSYLSQCWQVQFPQTKNGDWANACLTFTNLTNGKLKWTLTTMCHPFISVTSNPNSPVPKAQPAVTTAPGMRNKFANSPFLNLNWERLKSAPLVLLAQNGGSSFFRYHKIRRSMGLF